MGLNISGIGNTPQTTGVNSSNSKTTNKEKTKTTAGSGFNETAAVYEKSETATKDGVTKTRDNSAIVAQMKADMEERRNQLMDIVRQSLSSQAGKDFTANTGLKSLFEKIQVDQDTIAQAKADVAEDGYWGVEKTSDRMLEFAKALSGNDPSKAEALLDAFKKGYEQATKAWGDELPELCQKTYEAVVNKFNDWKNETAE